MKKLFINIQDIHIQGNPSELNSYLQSIDKNIEDMASESNRINALFSMIANNLEGKQFELAYESAKALSDELNEFSEKMNNLQKDVCKYLSKVNKFDLRKGIEMTPRRPDIKRFTPPSGGQTIKYTKENLNLLLQALNDFLSTTRIRLQKISSIKSDAGYIWRDTQYRDFSNQIDELSNFVRNKTKYLENYSIQLKAEIKDLD